MAYEITEKKFVQQLNSMSPAFSGENPSSGQV